MSAKPAEPQTVRGLLCFWRSNSQAPGVHPESELFPVFLRLHERPVLVVGGGVVASSKVDALLPTGARITVVAPDISESIRRAGVEIRQRRFEDSDLDGQWIVVSAAPPEVNRHVADAAARRHLFVNAVDDPSNATVYLGGVLRRDGVTIAISTKGRAPALAGLIREGLDRLLPADLERWFVRADEMKVRWRASGVPMEARRPELMDALIDLYAERRGAAEHVSPRETRALSPDGPPSARSGVVSLVGAGPGDPELLTVRAVNRLKTADVVFYDGLVPDDMVRLAPQAECVSVAKRAGTSSVTQADVNEKLISKARQGLRVVRLKAGDPFVLGRGGEEMLALVEAGVPVEIVPGLTTAVAAPALAGIPVTHRGMASGYLVVSGHAPAAYEGVLSSIAAGGTTVVVLMGVAGRSGIRACLLGAGWDPETPVAIVHNASRSNQLVWTGTLHELDAPMPFAQPDDPGVIVIGQVVSLAAASSLGDSLAREERSWQPLTIPRR